MLSDPPIVTYADEASLVATWRSVVFPIMGFRPSTPVGAMAQARAIESHGRAIGRGKLLEVSIIDSQMGIPDSEVRNAIDGMVPVIAPYYAAVAAIFDGDGFRAAVIRSVISSFQLLSRAKYPQRVFSNVAECGAWLESYGVESGTRLYNRTELIDAISSVRSEAERRGILNASASTLAG